MQFISLNIPSNISNEKAISLAIMCKVVYTLLTNRWRSLDSKEYMSEYAFDRSDQENKRHTGCRVQ